MASIIDMARKEMQGFKVKQPSKKEVDTITSQATAKKPKDDVDVITSQATDNKSKGKSDTTSRMSPSDKIGPNMGRDAKPKAKSKSTIKTLKDTSGDYWSPSGLSGDIGSASGEVGADMGQVNKGGYDAGEGMKRGGRVSSASKRADGCAVRGKTRA